MGFRTAFKILYLRIKKMLIPAFWKGCVFCLQKDKVELNWVWSTAILLGQVSAQPFAPSLNLSFQESRSITIYFNTVLKSWMISEHMWPLLFLRRFSMLAAADKVLTSQKPIQYDPEMADTSFTFLKTRHHLKMKVLRPSAWCPWVLSVFRSLFFTALPGIISGFNQEEPGVWCMAGGSANCCKIWMIFSKVRCSEQAKLKHKIVVIYFLFLFFLNSQPARILSLPKNLNQARASIEYL